MPPSILRLVCLFVLLTPAACHDDDAHGGANATEWTATVDTIADTIRVHTLSGQIWPADARLVSSVRIGVLDGAPEYQFGDIKAMAIGPDGRIYVLDGHGPVIRLYDPTGTYLRDVGREGEGPGEYKRPDSGLVMLPGGRLALRDPGNGRISVFSADGAYEESWALAGSMNTSRPMVATRDGIVVTPVIKNLGAPLAEWQRAVARYHPDGRVDTLDVPLLAIEEAMISGATEESSSQTNVPFTAEQEYTYSPLGYFVTGVTDAYHFLLLRPDDPVLEISMEYEPVSVLPDEAKIERERLTKEFRDNFPGWRWNGPPIPTTKPAYSAMLATDEGRIWVKPRVPSERVLSPEDQRDEEARREGPVNPYREPVAFDVFEPTGEYLGRVAAPAGFQMYPAPTIRSDTVWAVVTDELDVARVHRFVVDRDPAAAEIATRD